MSLSASRTIFPMFFGRRNTNKLSDGASTPLQLIRLKIEQQVHGNFPLIHQVAVTMTFKNIHNIVLEGAFEFTLPEKATICNYGLDVDGMIVDGVVVEKQAARIIFEKEVRKRIDPGFVELVTGNIFRTRVYPIEPQKTRTIRVIYQDRAILNQTSYLYQIPVQYQTQLESLDIIFTCLSPDNVRPQLLTNANQIFNNSAKYIDRVNGEYIVEWHLNNVQPTIDNNQILEYVLPVSQKSVLTAVENYDNENAYFAISCLLPKSTEKRLFNRTDFSPKTICILWDASISRSNSEENRLIELIALKEIFDFWLINRNHLDIILQIFRHDFDRQILFKLDKNNWHEFLKLFEHMPYDGATNLSQLSTLKYSQTIDAYFLCSDCLSTINQQTFDEKFLSNFQAPIWICNGNYLHEPFDHDFIRYLTQYNPYGGSYLNREKLESNASDLVSIIQITQIKYMKIVYSTQTIQQIYPSQSITIPLNSDRFLLVGQITHPLPKSLEFQLEFSMNNQIAQVPIVLNIPENQTNCFGLIRRLWAQEKLNELNIFKEKNKSEILALGLKYSIVSQFTSLLVLETLEQHLQYNVCPAQTRTFLYNEYIRHRNQQNQVKTNSSSQLIQQWIDKCDWYDGKPIINKQSVFQNLPTTSFSFTPQAQTSAIFPPFGTGFGASQQTFGSTAIPTSSSLFAHTTMPSTPNNVAFSFGSSTSFTSSTVASSTTDSTSTIVLNESDPQSTYLSRLSSTANIQSAYSIYLNERPNYRQSPSFYFNIASYFFSLKSFSSSIDKFNQKPLFLPFTNDKESFDYGLRILTNILELELEAPQLYRTVGYKLMELKQWNLALDVFRKVYSLRSDEPESLYDLALVLIELNQYDQALEYFKQIITEQWDIRFNDFQKIILSDYNRLINLTKKYPTDIDQRLLRHLPVDIRIVVQWDTPDTFVRLNVEKLDNIYHSNNQFSHQTNSNTYTTNSLFQNSSSPIEYLLNQASYGKYSIDVTLVSNAQHTLTGVTTVLVYIYKYFGSNNEEKQIKTVRLTSLNQTVEVGQIEFNNNESQYRQQSTIQHLNCTCDGCSKTPIIGHRYRCMICPNIDFCQNCHDSPLQSHDLQHPFICIRDSNLYTSSIYVHDMSALIHSNTRCHTCFISPIIGVRYQCTECKINICEKCEFLCLHDISHQRLKIILSV